MNRRQRLVGVALRLASLAAVFSYWQWYGSQPAHVATPPPTKVFPALWKALTSQGLVGDTLGTLDRKSVV